MASERGLGKCENAHVGSYGYSTRPEQQYHFCSQCGRPMVWACPSCEAPMPSDNDELVLARFCRHCGASYFGDAPDAVAPSGDGAEEPASPA